jgi:hypothetical protein
MNEQEYISLECHVDKHWSESEYTLLGFKIPRDQLSNHQNIYNVMVNHMMGRKELRLKILTDGIGKG